MLLLAYVWHWLLRCDFLWWWADVRMAALEALVDFTRVDGRWPDLEFLLDLVDSDPDPSVRHGLVRLLVENPPFERAHRHKLDQDALVHRLWNLIKYAQYYHPHFPRLAQHYADV
ncbi:hypothetical protein PR048_010008 [Dryococelus australis]|uniref:Transcription initiation factor TFIID subunit 2 TPR repeats domain-containing protein n=1 Tax=Dryococelus australis TaxID=614101 RepID=A0ABQ9I2H2_9NEOP|nr:hypothetical protein PR048_010008 [Dryococelus australis]